MSVHFMSLYMSVAPLPVGTTVPNFCVFSLILLWLHFTTLAHVSYQPTSVSLCCIFYVNLLFSLLVVFRFYPSCNLLIICFNLFDFNPNQFWDSVIIFVSMYPQHPTAKSQYSVSHFFSLLSHMPLFLSQTFSVSSSQDSITRHITKI